MTFTFGVLLLLLGALAAPNLVLAKKPELKPTLDKIVPFQGYMGVVAALWGIWGLINAILNMSAYLHWSPIFFVTMLATCVTLLGLGALLGVGTAKTFVKDANAQKKMDETVAKLAPFQGTLGLAGLGLGAWCIVAAILWHG